MKLYRFMFMFLFCSYSLAEVNVISFVDFEEGIPDDWEYLSQKGGEIHLLDESESSLDIEYHLPVSDKSFRGSYPASPDDGEGYVLLYKMLTEYDTSSIYVEFDAMMPSPTKHGLKFFKLFGRTDKEGASNTTFGFDFTGGDNGGFHSIGFGDGTELTNDAQNAIFLDGSSPDILGRSYGTAEVSLPQGRNFTSSDWGTSWHHFKIYFKFNSGTSEETEVADGEFYLEIDGLVYADAKNVFNRHYLNSEYINRIGLAGWTQHNDDEFEVWYDNIVVSTGGFFDGRPKMTTATKVID